MMRTQSRELLTSLEDKCPCRSVQIQQLTALYTDLYPPPRNLVVHGVGGTGKRQTVCSVLEARKITHAVVKSEECLSLRHLLSTMRRACMTMACAEDKEAARNVLSGRADTVNALGVSLQRLLHRREGRLVLVLDGIDRQRGLHPTTLPALVRLGDVVPTLDLIFLVATNRPLSVQRAGIPYLHFPPYHRVEAISLITRAAPVLAPQEHLDRHGDLAALGKWYSLFVPTVYDSLHSLTSLSVSRLGEICEALWPRFIWPYISGEKAAGRGKNNRWDFQKLLIRSRSLFQNAEQEILVTSLLPAGRQATTFDELRAEQDKDISASAPQLQLPRPPATSISSSFLPFFPTLLLIACYLASHTPAKLDILLFSRLSSSSRSARTKRNYHKRKLFQSPSKPKAKAGPSATVSNGHDHDHDHDHDASSTTTTTTARKKKKTTAAAVATTKPRSTKSTLDLNLNLPRPFTLERLVAILRAIHPAGLSRTRGISDRVARALVELERLRLVVSTDNSGGPGGGGGGLGLAGAGAGAGEERKWRVNVSRGFVEEVAGVFDGGGSGSSSDYYSSRGHNPGLADPKRLRGLMREFELD